MSNSPKLIALDFETANADRSSVCAIGLTLVMDGEIKTWSKLVRPPTMVFDPICVAVHGITPEMVASEPTFKLIFEETFMGTWLEPGHLLWAHNAGFERSCLQALSQVYGMQLTLAVGCTKTLWHRQNPTLENHRLNTICDLVGFPLTHHDAGSDAEGCAEIALAATRRWKRNEIRWPRSIDRKTKTRDEAYYDRLWNGISKFP
jgi:DNA polymerase-3 subunit epsilon